MVDAAHHLQVYDPGIIYSWSPKEFKNFIKGAQLRKIDEFEMSAANALFTASAQNTKKKKLSLKDIYDAEKARKEIESGGAKPKSFNLDNHRKAMASMKTYSPQAMKKGG